MLVLTLVLAAIGFGLLVTALTTGSVVWAWGCIVVCVIGAVVLLMSALSMREVEDETQAGPARHAKRGAPTRPTRRPDSGRAQGDSGDFGRRPGESTRYPGGSSRRPGERPGRQ
ncbi:hypothetical protein ACWDSJ_34870 [Nocardia sp. NPDC003482]